MKNYAVYMHTNLINGKIYIGQTCQALDRRWRMGKGYISSPHFYAAIEKYGWENFSHLILKDSLTAEEADYWEQFYIKIFKTQNPDKGYNILSGGNQKLKDYWSYEEHRQKQSQKRKQYLKTNPDELQKIFERTHTKEIHSKHSNFMKNQYNNSSLKIINEERKVAILCVETGEHFSSITEACKKYNLSPGNLSSVLSGKRKTTGGFHWIKL